MARRRGEVRKREQEALLAREMFPLQQQREAAALESGGFGDGWAPPEDGGEQDGAFGDERLEPLDGRHSASQMLFSPAQLAQMERR